MSSPTDNVLSVDPYAERPSFWHKNEAGVWAVGIFVLTVVLTVLSFPPFPTPEFAYAFASPAIFWAYMRPSFKLYAGTMFAAQAVAWMIILGWLHNVTWAGLFLLGSFSGAWVGLWYLAVWWAMPLIRPHAPMRRVLGVLGLAALWVFIEWTRTWVLGGFPWLPLSASQWQRSIILQIAAYTGAYGVSFILITFNLGFAAYGFRLLRENHRGLRKRSPEFMLALLVLMFPSFLLMTEAFNQDRKDLVRMSLVQPYIPQTVKWDPAMGPGIVKTLEEVTLNASLDRPDVILWPEAVTPWAVRGDVYTKDFVESLSARTNIPLLLGSIAVEQRDQPDEAWFNGVFVVTPDEGLLTSYYAKRQLVPFGEYVPIRPVLGWLNKFVPIGDDFQPGEDSHPLLVPVRGGALVVGPLVCYEDTYPQLARASVRAGAEVLTVHTNNGWFGEGGAAYQQAAQSVLRAVENRRPLVRVSNGGWSGWIDEYGHIRHTVRDYTGTIYFEGSQVVTVSRDQRWAGRLSYYTQHGDWFVLVCSIMALLGGLMLKHVSPPKPVPVEETEPKEPIVL